VVILKRCNRGITEQEAFIAELPEVDSRFCFITITGKGDYCAEAECVM
jgi:hypothetical protein